MSFNPDELDDMTPEQIAYVLFSEEPKKVCSQQLLAYSTEVIDMFDIMSIILVEGLNIFTKGLDKVNLNNLSKEHITSLDPWFKSVGFKLNVKKYKKLDTGYQDFYCRVVVKNNKNEHFFDFKGIKNPYHFVINGKYLDENKEKEDIGDLYGILMNDDYVFTFSFNLLDINDLA